MYGRKQNANHNGSGIVPPSTAAAERFVLGSVLFDPEWFPDALTADCFHIERHRRIFRRMQDLRGRGEPVDRVTVYNELELRGEIESGSLAFLMDLSDGIPTPPNADHYVKTLREHAARRRIFSICQNLMGRAAAGTEDLAALVAAVVQRRRGSNGPQDTLDRRAADDGGVWRGHDF